ncbi:MAG: hypothetical protein ABSE21_10165 [Bryobacteraceae bacterium]
MLGSMPWAAGKPGNQKVVACIVETGDTLVLATAKMTASRLFLSAGIQLEWHADGPSCRARADQVIPVSLSTNTPEDLLPGAMAFNRPYEGAQVRVFYDRITNGPHFPQLQPYLLAHVLVHEITHVLQGVDRHSKSGIMTAHWDSSEYALMVRAQLRFAGEDVELIHKGLTSPALGTASGTVVAASGLAAAQPVAGR